MNHTKGPWRVSKPMGDNSIIAIHPPHFYFQGKEVDKKTEANARLIAAAPELLGACKLMAKEWDKRGKYKYGNCGAPASVFAIKEAIAKAERGKS